MQAAVTECLHGMGAMCKALLDQLKSDAKLAVKQALAADGPFELCPKVSCLVTALTVPLARLDWQKALVSLAGSHCYSCHKSCQPPLVLSPRKKA